jgi:hypothetical protein
MIQPTTNKSTATFQTNRTHVGADIRTIKILWIFNNDGAREGEERGKKEDVE